MKKYLLRFLSINLFLFVGSSYALEHVDFPKTIADVSFKDRVENLKEGYEPFKDAKSYYQIHVTQTENTGCSEGEKQAIPHFNTGIKKDGVCKVTSCTDNYVPNSNGTACVNKVSNSGAGNMPGSGNRQGDDTKTYISVFGHINLANEEQGKTIINLYRQFNTHKPSVTDCERNDDKCKSINDDCLVCDGGNEVYVFDDLSDRRSKHVKKQAFRAVCLVFNGQDSSGGYCKADENVCSKITEVYNNSLFPNVQIHYANGYCGVLF